VSQESDLGRLFTSDTPFLDVRAPVEFAAGAFPTSTNLPILNDDERRRVGLCYKSHGQKAAIALGHRLVSGDCKHTRVDAWVRFCQTHPNTHLYCFRGGMRSRIACQWLSEIKRCPARIAGGYKFMRRFLLQSLEQVPTTLPLVVIGGRTGSGKTSFLHELDYSVDLEGLARHRGSGFGRLPQEQPSQVNFENAVAIALLKSNAASAPLVAIEDEGRAIGRRAVPPPLFQTMQAAPIYVLKLPFEQRVQNIMREYVVDAARNYCDLFGEKEGFSRYAMQLGEGLDRIRKRLGGDRHAEIATRMQLALRRQRVSGDTSSHEAWIATLLSGYYDPMYDYQMAAKKSRVAAIGDRDNILAAVRTERARVC